MADDRARTGDGADLNFSRIVDAPRDLLFDIWTDAKHLAQWFGPRDVVLPSCRIDPRPGGALHFCHRLGDGTEVWVKGVYREFVTPERLVFALSFVDASGNTAAPPMIPDWPLDTVIVTTVSFAELDGKTHLTIRQVLEPAEADAKDSVRRERQGARAGWIETLNRLDAYVGARA